MLSVPPFPDQAYSNQRLLQIHYWSPVLCSIQLSRPDQFEFSPGHYARLGLPVTGEAIWRPYSIVSAPNEPWLEFLITLIPNGQWTQQLAQLQIGDLVSVQSRCMGFFTENSLAAGQELWLFATGSGVGPYLSLLREAQVFQRYQRILLIHSVRLANELSYRTEFEALAQRYPLQYVPVVTREPGASALNQRIPELIASGLLEQQLDCSLNAEHSRVMVCGNPEFSRDMRQLLNARQLVPCRRGLAGSMLFENYW